MRGMCESERGIVAPQLKCPTAGVENLTPKTEHHTPKTYKTLAIASQSRSMLPLLIPAMLIRPLPNA